MFKTVRGFLNVHTTERDSLPAIAAAADALSLKIDQIDALVERQESPSEGITAAKAQRRDALEEQALLVAGGVAAFAAVTGDELLATTVRVTPTSLGALTDDAVDDAAERIFTAANDHLAVLADYGVTAANLAELRTRIEAFDEAKSAPQVAIANRVGMTATLPDLIRDASAILRERLDRLMIRFRTLDAEFYAAYQGARVIIDRRGPGEPDAPAGPAPTP